MTTSLNLRIFQFFHIYRFIAPLFIFYWMIVRHTIFMVVLVTIVYFALWLVPWLVHVPCNTPDCTGRLHVEAERVSFWKIRIDYTCYQCWAEQQAVIFSPNVEVTAEFS